MVNFTIHPLQSNDLRAAADCASATYSDGYYSVERIKEMSESENFTSYVAVDEAGSVAGHAGFRLFPAQNIAEMCAAFVSPDYRGGGCLNAIADFLVEEGERRGWTDCSCSRFVLTPTPRKPFTGWDSRTVPFFREEFRRSVTET